MHCRILVIDDDPFIRTFIGDALRYEGYTPILAASGKEGLEIATQSTPDLILLDMQMPRYGGLETARDLGSRHINIPIVVMTAGSNPHCLDSQVNLVGFLAKPFDLDDLLTLVDSLCQQRQVRPTFVENRTNSG